MSEVEEALYYDFSDLNWKLIDESIDEFVSIVSTYINEPMNFPFKKLLYDYGLIAATNPIAKFNLGWLSLNLIELHRYSSSYFIHQRKYY